MNLYKSLPSKYKCPITNEIMSDPVSLACNGHVYDRYALDNYIKQFTGNDKVLVDPMTKEVVARNYLPCNSLKHEIQQYVQLQTELLNKKKCKL